MQLSDLFFWTTANNDTGLKNITGDELAALIAAQGAGFPERCRFHSEININALTGQQRTVPWDDIQIDTNEFFNAGDDDRMTFKTAGVYIIGCQGQWNNDNAGGNFRTVQLQGSGISGQSAGLLTRATDLRLLAAFPLGSIPLQATTMVTFDADDFVECRITQDSGVTLEWQTSQEGLPIMWAQRVG